MMHGSTVTYKSVSAKMESEWFARIASRATSSACWVPWLALSAAEQVY